MGRMSIQENRETGRSGALDFVVLKRISGVAAW